MSNLRLIPCRLNPTWFAASFSTAKNRSSASSSKSFFWKLKTLKSTKKTETTTRNRPSEIEDYRFSSVVQVTRLMVLSHLERKIFITQRVILILLLGSLQSHFTRKLTEDAEISFHAFSLILSICLLTLFKFKVERSNLTFILTIRNHVWSFCEV